MQPVRMVTQVLLRLIPLLILCLCCITANAQAPLKPAITGPLVVGQTVIRVQVHTSGTYELRIKDNAAQEYKAILSSPVNEGTVEFRLANIAEDALAELRKGLRAGQFVQIALTGETLVSDEVVVGRTAPVTVLVYPPKEGDQVVRGAVQGDAEHVRVEVMRLNAGMVDFATAVVNAPTDSQPAKTFTAGMNVPLQAGLTVRVLALKGESEVAATDFTMVDTVGFDWGRARTYFSLGGTVAQTESKTGNVTKRSFDAADYFVSVNLDYNWFSNLRNMAAFPCPVPSKAREELADLEEWVDQVDGTDFLKYTEAQALRSLRSFRDILQKITDSIRTSVEGKECSAVEKGRLDYLEGFLKERLDPSSPAFLFGASSAAPTFEARIESAVRTKPFSTEVLSGARQAIDELDQELKRFRIASPSTPPSGLLFNTSFEARIAQQPVVGADPGISPNIGTVLQKPSAGYIEGTMYVPFWRRSMAWNFNDRENALFLAPIMKAGFIVANTSATDPTPIVRDIYAFHHYGVRLGHFALEARRRTVAPELVSYLDITLGKFGNFRPLPTTSVPNPPTATRAEIHGRLKLPSTPIYIGFTANLWSDELADDFRFFFGTRFDLSRMLAKALPKN